MVDLLSNAQTTRSKRISNASFVCFWQMCAIECIDKKRGGYFSNALVISTLVSTFDNFFFLLLLAKRLANISETILLPKAIAKEIIIKYLQYQSF